MANDEIRLITDSKQRLYFTGFSSTAGYIMLAGERKIFVVDNRYFYAAKKRLEGRGFEVVCGGDHTALNELSAQTGAKKLGIDFSATTISEAEELKAQGFLLFDIGEELRAMMETKSARELALIKRACHIAQRSLRAALPMIEEGVSEAEVAAELEHNFKRYGAQDKSFDTIVAFGPNTAVPHHETSGRRLKAGEPVLIDFGCVYRGYCSDMTRSFWFGGTPSREYVAAYNAVLDAHMEALRGVAAQISGFEADKIARDVLRERGLGQYFTHSLGHGIGVNIHESPYLSSNAARSAKPLAEGTVFSIEPGVYLDGKFGIRIEDTCIMDGGRAQSLMTMSKRLYILGGAKPRAYLGKGK